MVTEIKVEGMHCPHCVKRVKKASEAVENVTAAAYNAYVCRDKRISEVRGYKDVFDYLLFEENVSKDLTNDKSR